MMVVETTTAAAMVMVYGMTNAMTIRVQNSKLSTKCTAKPYAIQFLSNLAHVTIYNLKIVFNGIVWLVVVVVRRRCDDVADNFTIQIIIFLWPVCR